MRHVVLTCKNHPDLRWSCKSIAFDRSIGYTGARSLFFNGVSTGEMYPDKSGLRCTMYRPDGTHVDACACSFGDMILAPEDRDVVIRERDAYGKWITREQRNYPEF